MPEQRERTWLDEISIPTKIVIVITVGSTVALGVLKIVEMFR
jgi:hypothetical protein